MMLIEWCALDGARVKENQAICKLEIAWVYEMPLRQDVLEITSPVAGMLFQMARIGDVLSAGQRIADVIAGEA